MSSFAYLLISGHKIHYSSLSACPSSCREFTDTEGYKILDLNVWLHQSNIFLYFMLEIFFVLGTFLKQSCSLGNTVNGMTN